MLDDIRSTDDLRALPVTQLRRVADELRSATINSVAVTGGHLGASLGVVELTVALHYVFDSPRDRLIWDVGHQAYPHKILTGRRDRMHTLRAGGGLSGFTKRSESEYDPFGAAHAATSISAALGMATARELDGGKHHVVAVIGDGSLSAGMAYEALNNAGMSQARLIVILNDNNMSISPPVGALSRYFSKITTNHDPSEVNTAGRRIMGHLSGAPDMAAATAPQRTLFEDLGFTYVGPFDGHDLDQLLAALQFARAQSNGPIIVHVVTEKGKGYAPAEAASDKYHSVAKFDPATGVQGKLKSTAPSFTKVFAESLIREAGRDDRIVAITAAMPAGTGLDIFGKAFPRRTFDVGIAEQHAVTFAAGLAAEGYKPFCAIYSTFLQRGYDQVVHDVALQSLPVRFAIDRAGLVGADGPTHAGSFDLAYLGCLPGFIIMAAADEAELTHMIATAAHIDDRPSAFRYPRGDGTGVGIPDIGLPLEIGKGRVVRSGSTVALLSLGGRLVECLKAADELGRLGYPATVADARFAKPLDTDLVLELARHHEILVTVEEGAVGGFGSHVLHALSDHGRLDGSVDVRTMFLPDEFLAHDTPAAMYARAGLDAKAIVAKATEALIRRGRAVPRANTNALAQHSASELIRRSPSRLGHKRVQPMNVILAQPRGFCAGVVRAIQTVERALEVYGEPVYVRHEIVHNRQVVEGLKDKGARFVEELSEIPDNAVTIFSAHGVPRSVEDQAASRNLTVHDATCPLVTKVHTESRRYVAQGRRLILIGHAGHPEVIGTIGQVGAPVDLVQSEADVDRLDIAPGTPIGYVTQTTLSVDDTKGVIAALHRRFTDVVGPDTRDICYATQNRQRAVRQLCERVDVMLVVGAKNSSNSNRLHEISIEQGVCSHLIADSNELRSEWFEDVQSVGVTAGASAPETLVAGVVEWLRKMRPIKLSTVEGRAETIEFRLPAGLASI